MRDGHNQYAPMAGVMALRERLAEKTEALYGPHYDPVTEITVIASASEGSTRRSARSCIRATR